MRTTLWRWSASALFRLWLRVWRRTRISAASMGAAVRTEATSAVKATSRSSLSAPIQASMNSCSVTPAPAVGEGEIAWPGRPLRRACMVKLTIPHSLQCNVVASLRLRIASIMLGTQELSTFSSSGSK